MPKIEGYCNNFLLVQTDYNYPIISNLLSKKLIPSENISLEHECESNYFSTTAYSIKDTEYNNNTCNASCDGYYLDKCSCSQQLAKNF